MSDLINNNMTTDNMSNEEVIEVLKGIVFNSFDRTTLKERQALHLAIKSLEERPQGEWIYHTDGYTAFYTCNKCNNFGDIQDNFCRYCGADMRGDTNETDN